MESSLRLVVLICFIHLAYFVPIRHCRVFLPTDLNLIEQACRETPHRGLCVSALASVPESAEADVKGLALIMVDNVLKAVSFDTRNLIEELLVQSPSNQPLESCVVNYTAIIEIHIKQAHESITEFEPKFATQGMKATIREASLCESGFAAGRSLLTTQNTIVTHIAAVAEALVMSLPISASP